MQVEQILQFQQKIYNYYRVHRRSFSWRDQVDPYRVFISEVMLQQTQTVRVISKFEEWISVFPDFSVLASASTQQVLSVWQGLGYNRRGLALHKAAQIIVNQFDGLLPCNFADLVSLPGIGPNTAGSVSAFAFNFPVVFIETNIRTVFLHEFFAGQHDVTDKQILELIAATVDYQNPRDWYYALMDFGVYLKKELRVSNRQSKHYTRQSKFIGSRRQVRGSIVRILTKTAPLTLDQIMELVHLDLDGTLHDVHSVLYQLVQENIVKEKQDTYFL
jgi:A/G-specific adenine glycosylase